MSTTQTGAFKIDGGPRHLRWEPPRSPPLEPLQLQANWFSQSTVSVVFLFREGIQSSMRATGTHNQVCPALFPCASSLSLHNFSWWIADLTGFTWSSFHLLGMHLFHLPKGWKGQPHPATLFFAIETIKTICQQQQLRTRQLPPQEIRQAGLRPGSAATSFVGRSNYYKCRMI